MIELTELKKLLEYDPVAGEFYWLVKPAYCPRWPKAGQPHNRGYWTINLNGRRYQRSNLAWFYMTGEWPTTDLDHIDRDKKNDAFANLREATRQQNQANQSQQKRQRLAKGVRKARHTFIARIRVNGELLHIGSYPTVDMAHSAYLEAARHHFGEFATGG